MSKIVLALIPIFILVGLIFGGDNAQTSHFEEGISHFNLEDDMSSGWWLKVPEIGLETQLERVYLKGNSIPAPSGKAGYFLKNSGNIFINGHRQGVFERLGERPSEISLIIDGNTSTFYLDYATSTPKNDVDMDLTLNYQGVVLMTCDGTPNEGKYPDILTLFYREKP